MKRAIFCLFVLVPALLPAAERVLTHGRHGHLIHNSQIFSPNGRQIVFDSRNDETRIIAASRIAMADTATGEETTLYRVAKPTEFGPGVGAATFSPAGDRVIFIRGLDDASEALPYATTRRTAGMVFQKNPGKLIRLDARDVSVPLTAGALRGGTHAHHWSPDGTMVSFTYNDSLVLPESPEAGDLRTVGVISTRHPVTVEDVRPGEEFSGCGFAVVVVPVTPHPKPGSDEVSRACEEGWVGTGGYLRPDGSRQEKALAFIGTVAEADGSSHTDVFIADLPDDLTRAGPLGPLAGTPDQFPCPPTGVKIRRLTRTGGTPKPGLQGPRHWLRCSPDGAVIAFLDEDENGVIQLFGMSPLGGEARAISRLPVSIDTPFTWSPDGKTIACSAGTRIAIVDVKSGNAEFLTPPSKPGQQPRHGVVFSPDGKTVAFNRLLPAPTGGAFLQICLADVPERESATRALPADRGE